MVFLPLKPQLADPMRHGRPLESALWRRCNESILARAIDRTSALPVGVPEVTKKEIVATIAEEIGLTQLKTKEIVQKTFDAIVATLVRDGRIELRNFGVFEVKRRAPRKARNPRTGDKVSVPAKNVVTFKPGKEMEELVRKMDPSKLPVMDDDGDADNDGDSSVEAAPITPRIHSPAGADSGD